MEVSWAQCEKEAMKIAFIALPNEDTWITPPLPVAYLGALLEQQRHIVRMYDLALREGTTPAEILSSVQAFRPHIIVIAGNNAAACAPIEAALSALPACIVLLNLNLRSAAPAQALACALWSLEKPSDPTDEQSVIFEALMDLDDDLDALPFPARHLLSLEQYPLFTPLGELQTTLLTGQQFGADSYIPRNPALIVAELRSVAREHGIHHFIFQGPLLTADAVWLQDLLYHLTTSDVGIGWEGRADYRQLNSEVLRLCRRAGCERLCLPLDARDVLESKETRAALFRLVEQAHALGITIRAQIELNPSYTAMPMLVDIAATFGLDDVQFSMAAAPTEQQRSDISIELEHITEMVQSRYRSSVSRQFFIERFGPRMGPILWRAGRSGLLGRAWQRRADGREQLSRRALARGASA